MKILAIETSCDETAVSLVECTGGVEQPKFRVLGDALNSQIELHKEYGGVYPNLAKREHANNLVPLLMRCLSEAGYATSERQAVDVATHQAKLESVFEREPALFDAFLTELPRVEKPDIEHIAVTYGPGLAPALWVGVNFARALSLVWDVPLVPVNHMEGHIASVLLDYDARVALPALAVLVSGGHTQLISVDDWGRYSLIGQTRDDAIGEAFDKAARVLELGYPGGPAISQLAAEHRTTHPDYEPRWNLPRPMIDSGDYDFSFSGIKTAVRYAVQNQDITPEIQHQLAREFEDAVLDVVVTKTERAVEEYDVRTLIVGGGVVANPELRTRLESLTANYDDLTLLLPRRELATDNATMIAMAGCLKLTRSPEAASVFPSLNADANASLTS